MPGRAQAPSLPLREGSSMVGSSRMAAFGSKALSGAAGSEEQYLEHVHLLCDRGGQRCPQALLQLLAEALDALLDIQRGDVITFLLLGPGGRGDQLHPLAQGAPQVLCQRESGWGHGPGEVGTWPAAPSSAGAVLASSCCSQSCDVEGQGGSLGSLC